MSSGNTRNDTTVSVSFTPGAPGDCISDAFIREFQRRAALAISAADNPGDAVVSVTAPEDTSKIWYPADANGFPTGAAYKFDTLQGQWISTAPIIQDPPCNSQSEDNIIEELADGCWKVSRAAIQSIAESVMPTISADSGNSLRLGSDGGFYVQVNEMVDQGRMEFISTPVLITTAVASVAPTTSDLALLAGVTIPPWATHAVVRAKVEILAEDLASNSTDKSYALIKLGGNTVAEVGRNPGNNNALQFNGTNTNDNFVVMNGTEIGYEFELYEAPDWDGAVDYASFSLYLVGFVRAGIPS